MFTSTKIIAAITKTKIKVFCIKLGDSPLIEKQEVYEWNSESLATIFQTIKKDFGPSIRILFSDEFVYLTTVKIANSSEATREAIKSVAQELIPEDMNKTSWDYRVYPDYIQVVVLNKIIYTQITDAVKKAEIHIEAIEPYSTSLARLTTQEQDPFILLFQEEEFFIVTITKGIAVTTKVTQTPPSASDVEKIVRFSEEHFNLPIKKIIKTQSVGEILTTEFFKDFSIETKQLEPAVGMALKTDIKVPDASSLNLEIDSAPVHTFDHKMLIPYVAFFVTFALTVVSTFMGQHFIFKNDAKQESFKPIVSPTAIPTVTPTPVISEEYSIKVLNASGIEGEASRLETILNENNYHVTSIGNVPLTRGISVHYSAKVEDTYLDELDKVLKNIYTTVTTPEAKLAPDEADITIIIGTFKPK